MRLVDADALFKEEREEYLNNACYISTYYEHIFAEIDNAPTVEDKPQGEWINDTDAEKSICSICNHELKWIKYDRPYEFKYCPFCGERLGKEQE